MSNEYYGAPSTPTSDFLAHYGVRGMKWGVRKAIDRGNDRAVSRQYQKAEKKLAKLEAKANLKKQAQIVSEQGRKQKTARRIGEAGLALGAGHAAGSVVSATKKAIDMAKKTGVGYGVANITPALALGAAGAAALVGKSIHKHKKNQAVRRMSSEGHKKAVAERDAFRREMQSAFKGTRYENQIKRRRR